MNERSKLKWEQFKRKEESYKELLRCLRGFYVLSQETQLKAAFLDQVNLCWLYAPDDVIGKAYKFLGTVKTGANTTDVEKEKALGELVEAIRKDILSRKIIWKSKLKAKDFRGFNANQNSTTPG